MAQYFSQGSAASQGGIDELADEYRQLLGGNDLNASFSKVPDKAKYANLVWTRVLSMRHFEMSGCLVNNLGDDLQEAQEEISAPATPRNKDWKLVFDPKVHELPRGAVNLERHRLPEEELEELGAKAARLRYQVKQRVEAIKGEAEREPGQEPPSNDDLIKRADLE